MSTTMSYQPTSACPHGVLRRHNHDLCPICHSTLIQHLGTDRKLWATKLAKERERRTAKQCRESLAAFFRASWDVLEPTTPLVDSWIYDVCAKHAEAQFRNWQARKKQTFVDEAQPDPLQNLMINLPPGTAKSRFFSVAFNAWIWLHDPSVTVFAVSQNKSVVQRDADLLRNLIDSDWYKRLFAPQWVLRGDKNAVGYFQLQGKSGRFLGWRKSLGIDAEIVGERCDFLLVDDPHDPHDVLKGDGAALTGPIEVYSTSLHNRLNNLAVSMRLIVAHRVHKHDLCGHLLARRKQTWLELSIPLERGETWKQTIVGWVDPRKPGERVLPQRNTTAVLATEMENFGDLFQALYNQAPSDFSQAIFKGGEFRWFRFADRVPYGRRPSGANSDPARVLVRLDTQRFFDSVTISVDANMAKTNAKAKGSFVGLQVWGLLEQDKFLIDVRSAPLGFNEMVDAIKGCLADYPEATIALIEDKANGPAAIAQLQTDIPEIHDIQPQGSKEGRARACTGQVRAGRVYIQEGQPWNDRFCAQVFSFPFTPDGRNDDVDAMTQVLNWAKANNFSDRLDALSNLT